MDTVLCCPNPLFRTEGLISSADGKNCPLLKRASLLKFHAFELRIKMAQLPHPSSGQLGRAIPAPGIAVQSAKAVLWFHWSPTSASTLSCCLLFPTRCWSWELCFLHTNLHISVCFLGKPFPHSHLLPEYLRLREFFSHVFRNCLPSAASPRHVLLSVTTRSAVGQFLNHDAALSHQAPF